MARIRFKNINPSGSFEINGAMTVTGNTTLKQNSQIVSSVVRNITLNCPAYTFNPVFESAYVSNAVRRIEYTDLILMVRM
jgi:hypothetical protein